MQVDKQQFQILNALDAILNVNRQSELPQLIEAAGADKIINADLMNLARKLKRSAVVNFLATLITHNSAKPEQAPLILDAYQSIASSKLQAALLALSPCLLCFVPASSAYFTEYVFEATTNNTNQTNKAGSMRH